MYSIGSFTLSFRGRLDYFNKEGAKPSSQIALEFLYIYVIAISQNWRFVFRIKRTNKVEGIPIVKLATVKRLLVLTS